MLGDALIVDELTARVGLPDLSVPALAAGIAVIGGLTLMLAVLCRSRGDLKLPPARSGWIPWLGVAIPFGKEPLKYLQRCRDEVSSPAHLLDCD